MSGAGPLGTGEPPAPAGQLLSDCVASLRSPETRVREQGMMLLSERIEQAHGVDGKAMGKALRELDGVLLVCDMLLDSSIIIVQEALLALSNLCSDAFDPDSASTKAIMLASGAHRALAACVKSEDPATLAYACGSIQNLCQGPQWAVELVNVGVHERLQEVCSPLPEEGRGGGGGVGGERHTHECRHAATASTPSLTLRLCSRSSSLTKIPLFSGTLAVRCATSMYATMQWALRSPSRRRPRPLSRSVPSMCAERSSSNATRPKLSRGVPAACQRRGARH